MSFYQLANTSRRAWSAALAALCGVVFLGSGMAGAADSKASLPVQVMETELTEPFRTGVDPKTKGWSSWKPSGGGGSVEFDTKSGRNGPGSLCVAGTQGAIWRKALTLKPGGLYRFSGWIKTDDAGAEMGLAVQPLMNGPKKFNATSQRQAVESFRGLEAGNWQPFEVIWAVPMSGAYGSETFAGFDLEFFVRNTKGKAWCDDLRVEKIRIPSPWYEGFERKTLDWELSSRPGTEGEGAVSFEAEGFADPGALHVRWVSGTPGFSAARTMSREQLAGSPRWTFVAYARALGGAKPSLAIQQLDADGKILAEEGGKPLQGFDWGPLQLTTELKEKTARVKLLLLNGGTGSAAFDQVLLRPSTEGETAVGKSKLPIRVGVFPADAIGDLSKSEPSITALSRQASAFSIFLAGERRPGATTTLDLELPAWMKVLTAQYTPYGREPLSWETLPGTGAGRITYRFTNPYPWENLMQKDDFNPYNNLIIVFEADENPGAEGQVLVRSALDKDVGQERALKVLVREAIRPLPRLEEFHVGLWDLQWINVVQVEAREKILGTYAAAGVNLGHFRANQAFAVPTFQQLGLTPILNFIMDPSAPDAYRATPGVWKAENKMRLASGRVSEDHLALGLALGDPATHEAYKAYLGSQMLEYPALGKYVSMDVEYWGEGATRTACFHPSTIAAFRKYAKIPESAPLSVAVILKDHAERWADFRLWHYVEMHRLARQFLREIKSDTEVFAYDYPLEKGGREPPFARTSPMSTLRVDPYVDGHMLSTYNREGMNFIEALENSIPYLKKPVWAIPYLMQDLCLMQQRDYNYRSVSPREYRFEVVAAAAFGAKGFMGFPGRLLDADYLHALRDGLQAVSDRKDFYFKGKREDRAVELMESSSQIRATVHVLGDRSLLTVFNAGVAPAKVGYRLNGRRDTCEVESQGIMQVEVPK